jgi:ribosomal protein L29
MKDCKEMRDQSLEELTVRVKEARSALFEMRNQRRATKKLEQPHLMTLKRREIARLLTVKREKQLEESEG